MERYRTTKTWAEMSWLSEIEAIDLEHNQANEIFNENLVDLCDNWQAMLDAFPQMLRDAKTQEEVFKLWESLNHTANQFNQELGGGTFFRVPANPEWEEISQRRLWEIKHPVSAAIAMGEIYKYTVCGTIIVELKKEVNV